jgi:DNA-binding NtrC family response regulator
MARPRGGRTVVVADDDAALRLLCRVNLELEGYQVLEVENAHELGRVLAREDVALLLLDVHLGRDDGVDVARRLRHERPELPIAFFSGTAPDLPPATREIADGFLAKPFSLEALSEIVRRLARA